jgi:E3 ubiquitin-protein ligase SHPRH
VERNILDLAARQGLSLYTEENAAGTLNMAAFANDSSKTADTSIKKKVQKGDFIFKWVFSHLQGHVLDIYGIYSTDDMLAILFPHLFEDIEYLLPEEDGMDVDSGPSLQLSQSQDAVWDVSIGEAGPSGHRR